MAFTVFRFGFDYATTGTSGPPIGIPHGGGGLATYPKTVGGVTLGATDDGGSGLTVADAPGWVSGDDLAARGRWRVTNTTTRSERIDLDVFGGAGPYNIVLGVAALTFQQPRWRIRDGVGGASLIDVSWSGADAGAYGNLSPADLDQVVCLNTAGTGITNVGAIDTDLWTPALPYATRVFSGSVLEIVLGAHASGAFSSDLSFIALEKVVTTVAPGFTRAFASI